MHIYTGWCTKCLTIDCTYNTFLLLQKHLTSGTELILKGWKIVPNEEHVQCDHRFASHPLANKPLYSSQLFNTSLQKARSTTSLWALSCTIFSGLLWNTFSFKNPHKKKLHGLISGLWGGHNLPPSWRSGNRCDITQRLNVSYRKSRTTFAVCGWAPSCMNDCVCIGGLVAKRWGMKLFSNMSLCRSLVTVSWKKNGPMIPWVEIAVQTLTFAP